MATLLALALTSSTVVVSADGPPPCDGEAVAQQLRALRPDLEVRVDSGSTVPKGQVGINWRVQLEGAASGEARLRISGPRAVERSLPGLGCELAAQTAASIADGLLEELPATPRTPALEAESALVAPAPAPGRRLSLAGWLQLGVEQGPAQWVPALGLGVGVSLGVSEVTALIEVGFPAGVPLATADEGALGTYQTLPLSTELGAGVAPRLGPGALAVDAAVGAALAFVSSDLPAGAPLFERQSAALTELFIAVRGAYRWDVTPRTFFGIGLEERWSPDQARISVTGGTTSVLTRIWTFSSSLSLGRRFF